MTPLEYRTMGQVHTTILFKNSHFLTRYSQPGQAKLDNPKYVNPFFHDFLDRLTEIADIVQVSPNLSK